MPAIAPPTPPLQADGILLRPHRRSDAPAVVRACQDPEIPRWTEVPEPYTEADYLDWIAGHDQERLEGRGAPFVAVDADSGELLASIGLVRLDWDEAIGEVGYWVAPWARRRGVATIGTRLISRWSFEELGLERLELLAAPGNEASQRVALAAGFTREGVLRAGRRRQRTGQREDLVLFSLLPGDLGPA